MVTIVLVNLHSLTEKKNEEEKDEFYSLLDSTLSNIPRNNIQVVLGYFNVEIGQEKYFKLTIGTHSVHQVSNKNGCRLIELATDKGLKIKNTLFLHKTFIRVPGQYLMTDR